MRLPTHQPAHEHPTVGQDSLNLADDVDTFIALLKHKYPQRIKTRPNAFKQRVLRLIAVRLPPYPRPAGRPRQPLVSRATDLYRRQRKEVRQGNLRDVNWLPTARECIPGFNRATHYRRLALIRNLRNAVYVRLNRVGAKKLPRRLSDRTIPVTD
jgi:hypothetical protein